MNDETPGSLSRRSFIQASAASLVVAPNVLGAALGTTVAKYILARLNQHGVDLLFGVPGATCDPLFAATVGSPVSCVINSSDLEAGYAADGYARMRGLSAVGVTHGVGTLSLLSVIGGAFAERSPVVIINGGPSPEDLRTQKELGLVLQPLARPREDRPGCLPRSRRVCRARRQGLRCAADRRRRDPDRMLPRPNDEAVFKKILANGREVFRGNVKSCSV